jgi:hypothetical protein
MSAGYPAPKESGGDDSHDHRRVTIRKVTTDILPGNTSINSSQP